MAFKILKKKKQEKEELAKIQKIIEEIQEAKEKSKTSKSFQLINSDYGNNFLINTMNRSIEEKNSFYVESIYQMLTSWDNYGDMSLELGKWLEQLISKEDIQIGIHRTGGYGMIDPNEVYNSSILYDIFDKGLYITGDISSGVDHKGEIIQPNKNISPLNNILEGIMYAKSSYKHSTGGIITSIPSEYVTESYSLKDGAEEKIYTKVDNQWTLKPEYLVGFIAQDKGVCTFYSKEDILTNYKEKNNSSAKK